MRFPFERRRGRADREEAEATEALRLSKQELWRSMLQHTEAVASAGELKRLQGDKDALAEAVRHIFEGD